MSRVCTVCHHPDVAAINKALVAGEPVRAIASRYVTLSHMAVQRHREDHLPAELVKAKDAEDVGHAIDIVKQLRAINGTSLAVLNEARLAGNGELALKAIDRVHRQIELQAKLLGELDDRPQVNVMVSAEWVAVRTALLAALGPYPEARVAVAAQLMALESPNGHRG